MKRYYRMPSCPCTPTYYLSDLAFCLTRLKTMRRLISGTLIAFQYYSIQTYHNCRSTNMPRTIESLQQVIHGLYPTEKFSNGIVPRIRIRFVIFRIPCLSSLVSLFRHPKDENLMGNAFVCARLKELMIQFEKGEFC